MVAPAVPVTYTARPRTLGSLRLGSQMTGRTSIAFVGQSPNNWQQYLQRYRNLFNDPLHYNEPARRTDEVWLTAYAFNTADALT